jgi:predicted lipid-binding transport protein (Tim44 family)
LFLAVFTLAGAKPLLADVRHYGFHAEVQKQGSFHYCFGNRQQNPDPSCRAPAANNNYGTAHPFWTGLVGVLFGGWLGLFLFPHGGAGFGFHNVVGSILGLLVLLWIVRHAARAIVGRARPAFPGAGSAINPGVAPASGTSAGASAVSDHPPLAITGADYAEFERILKSVQQAWNNADLAALGALMTPDMASSFAGRLAQNRLDGVESRVANLELLRGDLRTASDQGAQQSATCYLRWRAVTFTARRDRKPGDPDYVVSGDPDRPAEAAETWTFVRSPGGPWRLSAIGQA